MSSLKVVANTPATTRRFNTQAVDTFETRLRSEIAAKADVTRQLQQATDALNDEIHTIEHVARETIAELRRRHAAFVAKIVAG